MGFFFTRLTRYAILILMVFYGTQYLLKSKGYNFTVKEFKALADKNKGEGASSVVKLASDLRRAFGAPVSTDVQWSGFQAGGLQLKALVLHGSLTEFIIVFNAPFATTGRSGLHFANTTCTVLSGSVSRVADLTHSDTPQTFGPGGNFRTGEWESYLYTVKEKTYVVCYGRGLIPVSSVWAIPQNVAGGDLFSTGRFFYFYGKSCFENFAHSLQESVHYLKRRFLKSEL